MPVSSVPVVPGAELPLMAMWMLKARGDPMQALALAEAASAGCRSDRVATILRAAINPGGTSDPAWAGPLVAVSRAFLESLRPVSFASTLSSFWRQVPLGVKVTANSATVVVGPTGETRMKRASSFSLTDGAIEPLKTVVFIALSSEVLRAGDAVAANFLGAELRTATATSLDGAILDLLVTETAPIVAADTSPTSILSALRNALATISQGSASKLVGAVGPVTAAGLATLADGGVLTFPELDHGGGVMAGIQVVAVAGVQEGTLVIADGARIAGSLGPIVLDASEQAALRLSDDGADPDAANIVTSLWQSNMSALRGEVWWGCERLDPDAVAVISGLVWP